MRTSKKLLSSLLAAACIIGAAGCGGGGGRDTGNNGGGDDNAEVTTTTTADPNAGLIVDEDLGAVAENYEYDEKNEAGAGANYKKGESAGKLKLFFYYDPKIQAPESAILPLFAERFGGTLDEENYVQASGSLQYMDELAVFIQANDSPDIIRMEWPMLPAYILKNSFTAMDDWVDLSDPVWDGIREAAESWSVKGKHYYYPTRFDPNYGVGYNTKCVEDMGMEDPMDLYFKNEWTWDVMEDMLKNWMQQGSDKIGISAGESSALQIACTTGVAPIELNGAEIINNLKNAKIMRAMEFAERLNRNGYVTNQWIAPNSLEAWDGKLLFTIMPAEWTLDGQEIFFKNNLEGELRVVPLPRDPESDAYYQPSNTYGYLVPTGAKNLQGATSWILAARIYETDPEVLEKNREEKTWEGGYYYDKCSECGHVFESRYGELGEVCPECSTPRKERWLKRYTDRQMQVFEDMVDSSKFTFVSECHRGFGSDVESLMHGSNVTLFDTPLKGLVGTDAFKSYAQLVDENYDMVETLLNNYREMLK